MTLSVIIPCFNERRTIRMIVEKVKAVVSAGTEIIIVDDASTDGTSAIVGTLAGDGVTIVHHAINRGKGAAMETVFGRPRETSLMQDADLEYDPRDYAELLSPIENGEADVVFGSVFWEAVLIASFIFGTWWEIAFSLCFRTSSPIST